MGLVGQRTDEVIGSVAGRVAERTKNAENLVLGD